MENLSQKVCADCNNLDECVKTAVCHPGTQIKCIHFGYIRKASDDYMTMLKNEFDKFMKKLIGMEEN